jgi:hypothetical protein
VQEYIFIPCIGKEALQDYDAEYDKNQLNDLIDYMRPSLRPGCTNISCIDCTQNDQILMKILVGDTISNCRFKHKKAEEKINWRGLLIIYGINQLCWIANLANQIGSHLQYLEDTSKQKNRSLGNFYIGRLRVCDPGKEELSAKNKDETDHIVEQILSATIQLYKTNYKIFELKKINGDYCCMPIDISRSNGRSIYRNILGVSQFEELAKEIIKIRGTIKSLNDAAKIDRNNTLSFETKVEKMMKNIKGDK